MIKYNNYDVVFNEIPNMVSLAINITNCQNCCIGCHSAELKMNIGNELTLDTIDNLMKKNLGVNCVILMGEGNDKNALIIVSKYIKSKYNIDIAIYSGSDIIDDDYYNIFDYIKIGHYDKILGDLSFKTTNQRLYKIINSNKIDITSKLWKI
jgi:anaerobic ribonucleoside-triphosphate reductase activating protein